MKRLRYAAMLLCMATAQSAVAEVGDWDTSFGTNGHLTISIGGSGEFEPISWASAPSGKYVVAGWSSATYPATGVYTVARVNGDGSLDTTFNGTGTRSFNYSNIYFGTSSIVVAVQPDGKVVLAIQGTSGSSNFFLRVVRLNEDGTFDANFGNAGIRTLNALSWNPKMALTADGSIYLGTTGNSTPSSIAVTKLTGLGAVDASFGTGGMAQLATAAGHLALSAMTIAPNGSIAVGGSFGTYPNAIPYVGRLTASGAPDTTFGTGGIAIAPDPLDEIGSINAIGTSADNKVYAAGTLNDRLYFIARLNANGALDSTFGSGGRIMLPSSVSSIVAEDDGVTYAASNRLGRLASDGSPNLAFGIRGGTTVDLSANSNFTGGLIHLQKQSDGSYMALNRQYRSIPSVPGQQYGATLLRFLSSGASAGAIGIVTSYDQVTHNESTSQISFSVSRFGGNTGVVSAQYRAVGVTATADEDFVATTGTITFQDGDSAPKTVSVPLINDFLYEPNTEEFYLELLSPTGGVLGRSRASARIASEDQTSSVGTVATSIDAFESAGTLSVAVQRSGEIRAPLSVNYSLVGYSATSGSDFVAATGTIAWAADEGGIKTVDIQILDDALIESFESFSFVLGSPSVPVSMSQSYTTINVIDNDDPSYQPSVGFIVQSVTVSETAPTVTLGVYRAGNVSGAISVDWTTGNVSAISGQDYVGGFGTLSWSDGDNAPKYITVALLNNPANESTESFYVAFGASTPSMLSRSSSAVVIIADNPVPVVTPSITITASSTSVSENAGTLNIELTLSAPSNNAVSVTLQTNTETATSADISSVYSTRSFAPGTTQLIVPISITNDALDEADETFYVLLSSPNGATLANTSLKFTIVDDDPTPPGSSPPSPMGFEFAQSAVSVGERQHSVTLQVIRRGDASAETYAYYYTSGGSATSPSDYLGSFMNQLHWPPGDSSPKAVEILLNGDSLVEGNETFSVILSPSSRLPILSQNSVVVTLIDGEPTPTTNPIPTSPITPVGNSNNEKKGGGGLSEWALLALFGFVVYQRRRKRLPLRLIA